MYFAFSQEQEDFKASLRNLLVDQMPTWRVRESFQAGYDKGLWKVLTNEMAITGLHLPEALGGQGFTYQETALVMAELGRCLAPVPVLATNLAIEAIRAEDGIFMVVRSFGVRRCGRPGLRPRS